ncbi:valine--tRNA ligase [[Mycoplasma] mobile]|uniref:Valine--tRNA ligase n=1 Tax=Mycoplasma mobile (strain ATCC 43663 / 163K / NCTC 11711) TaxID=267748 RepID=SYV_MYCM1|nr:valine--tRNA ligase [[Mycoplasma] mobile]Q6KID2.1 RecName: Full=Valine--tRNA ligase; AltName: Full=Valyl-tRNA synthetase; Short=ValRS [Mycoplasma mobile 163K]AAT27644.1 valyl-tRNA synthetase [Mycoplasma mobile 163K]
MEKIYNHKIVEKDKNEKWIKKEYFSTHDLTKKPFSILLPPPNVTGKLHIGHAWNTTLQDFLIRLKRLQGYDVLWLPGTDHAGIATQAKVEKRLLDQKIFKSDLTKEELFEKAMDWKNEYANEIKKQWSKLGLALDYKKERFTLDELSNKAVNDIFVMLYKDGYIYRGNRAIYYDTFLQTSLSNIEVINVEKESKMYYLKYFLENSNSEYVLVATTRPETLASDVALIINPNDKKNSHYLGKNFVNPLTKKIIKMHSDDYAIMNFGSGIVKISAHDMNDFDVIKRLNLEVIETIDKFGKMTNAIPEFENMSSLEARENIVLKLKKENLIDKIENIKSNIIMSERSNTVAEVLVMPQWFIKMEPFSKMILKKIQNENEDDKKVLFFPKKFENILKIWMQEAHDWNISRQLWWGHKIPAWYDEKGNIKVQTTSPGSNWTQDQDVLDTWFSSGIAPFSFLNWPQKSEFLKRYYPTSVIVTAYDIIFFWVARMYFMGIYSMKNIPFKKALIHGLIRDEQGRKMSKSLGNGIDPMDLIEKYGADSLRWFLMTNSTPGQDIRFNYDKIESAWSLINKIWNISRYIKMLDSDKKEIIPEEIEQNANSWILEKFENLKILIYEKSETFEFSVIGKEIFKFINEDFSSVYIEIIKGTDSKEFISKIWSNFLILLHPFLPFLTDHLYFELNKKELLESDFFELKSRKNNLFIDETIEIISTLREYRTRFNLSHKIDLNYNLVSINNSNQCDFNLDLKKYLIKKMANANFSENGQIFFKLNNYELRLQIPEEVKKEEETIRIKRILFLESEIKRSQSILSNEKFINNASEIKVKEEKEKLEKYIKEFEEIK